MSIESQILRCPYCGGDFDHSPNQGGIEKHTCKNCGYVIYIENESSKEKLFALNAFRNEVINLLHAKIDGGKSERIANWKRHENTLEDYIEKCGGESNQDPLFAIARAAHITDGFEQYTSKEAKEIAESLYNTAQTYVNHNDKAINIKTLVSLYKRKLRNKPRNLLCGILGGILGTLLVGAIIGWVFLAQYTPLLTDPNTGITISVPNDAVPMFEKTKIDIYVEEHPHNSVAYIDAKNALHNETEKFELYDISLLNGQEPLQFEGNVTVEIPIPNGYLLSALKVYHILSDEEFEEIPSTVSASKNTISFKVDHFSYFAVAERHPIVIFDTDGVAEINRQIVQRDTLAQKPEDPQKEGFTFVGWMLGTEVWDFATDTVKKDIVLKAKWEPTKYTITLEAEGTDHNGKTFEIAYTNAYSSLPTAERDGYTFKGWYTGDAGKGEKIENGMPMLTPGDHTLYAFFAENTNKVIFDSNGGTGTMEDQELKTGQTAKLSENEFEKAGYKFLGWSMSKTGQVEFDDQAEYEMGTASTTTLYAVWEAEEYDITFNSNGGTNVPSQSYNIENGTSSLPTPTQTGYTFAGWYENSDLSGNAITKIEKGTYGNLELYAKWDIIVSNLHFNANGGEGTMKDMTLAYKTTTILPQNTFLRPGYTFAGWSTSVDGDIKYGDMDNNYTIGIEDETLYARWTIKQIELHFNANGGTTGRMDTITKEYNVSFPLPQNEFKREGYTFVGWSTSPNGGKEYDDNETFTMGPNDTYTLYALWKGNTNAFVFNANGGKGNMPTDFTIETGSSKTLPLNQFTRNGYTFLGWSTSTDGVVEYTNGITYTQDTSGDVELYAVWKMNTYTILFETNGGSEIPGRSYTVEDTFAFSNPTKTGYIFAGWYEDAGFHGEVIEQLPQGSYGNKTYYAKWAIDNYSIVFNSNGGSNVVSISYNIETEISSLPSPTKNGYTFAGWYQNSNLGGDAVTAIAVGSYGNIQLYAKWSLTTYYITFNVNGGETLSNLAYTIESHGISLPTPTKTGYTFEGWYEDAEFHGDIIEQLPQGSYGNKTYYAKWEVNSYSITFNANGGSVSQSSKTVTYGSVYGELPIPERAGYIFVGWYLENDVKITADTVVTIEGTCTLYAQWETIVAISANIKTPATKLYYYVGDAITAEGLTVEVRYNDNTVKTVSRSELSIHYVDMTTVGVKTVTVSYEGVSVNYTIEVKELTISLSATTSTASNGYVTFIASTPAGTVSWKSSNTSVVTIDENGVATFKNVVGVATITATVTNGSCTATATKTITLSNTSGTKYGETFSQTTSTILYGTRPDGYKTELPVLISIPEYSVDSADITDSNVSTSTGRVSTSFVNNGVAGYVYYQFNYNSSSGADNVNKIIHYKDDWRYNMGSSSSDNFRYYTSYGRQFYSTTDYPEHEANKNWTKYYAIWWAYQDKQAGHTWYVAPGISGALAASWYRFTIYNYTKTVTTYTYWYYTID